MPFYPLGGASMCFLFVTKGEFMNNKRPKGNVEVNDDGTSLKNELNII